MIKVGVIGAHGRMGSATCDAVEGADDLELVAKLGPDDDLQDLIANGAQVAVDFTTPDAVMDNVTWLVTNHIDAVIGTTGLDGDRLGVISKLVHEHGTRVFVAPNFALGAVLMMAFARKAAAHYDSAEIIERHHEKKLDAPSGTSIRTAELMAEGHGGPLDPLTEVAADARGEVHHGVSIHSLRLPGSIAHQEVIFGGTGETLTIKHDSLDRASFMPGVLMAVRKVKGTEGLTIGLESLLDL